MIRRSILSHARPALLLMLVAVAAPIPAARSQDRAIQVLSCAWIVSKRRCAS